MDEPLEQVTMRKVAFRLIPFLCVLYIIAFKLYVLRFLLSAAEAGFFPRVILYLTYWFPKRWRGQVTAGFISAIPITTFTLSLNRSAKQSVSISTSAASVH